MTFGIAVLLLVTLQRLGELIIARRNTRHLLEQGAWEAGRAHYPCMIALHAGWLAVIWISGWDQSVQLPWLAGFALMQVARIWVLATLGRRWTTRIIILPGAPLVKSGPFRWVSHPNYCIVTAEIALLPLSFGLIGVAAAFSLLNAAMLFVRIRCENAALNASARSARI